MSPSNKASVWFQDWPTAPSPSLPGHCADWCSPKCWTYIASCLVVLWTQSCKFDGSDLDESGSPSWVGGLWCKMYSGQKRNLLSALAPTQRADPITRSKCSLMIDARNHIVAFPTKKTLVNLADIGTYRLVSFLAYNYISDVRVHCLTFENCTPLSQCP